MLISKTTQTIPLKLPPPLKIKSPAVHRTPIPTSPSNHRTTPTVAVSVSASASVNRSHVTTVPSQNDVVEDDVSDDSVAAFWDYQFLFMSQRAETAEPVALSAANGVVPADFPGGTYYLTGPGIFSDDHGSTVHPLDGHGYLRAFTFERSDRNDAVMTVKFMARYVRTDAKNEEHESETDTWRFTHRGPFSVLRGGRKLGNTKVMKNVANTSVLMWARRLMCLWEGGDPYEVQSGTLRTVGKVDLVMDGSDSSPAGGGVLDFAARLLKPILYGVFKMPPKRLLSHYKLDAQRDRLLTVTCNAEDMLLPRSNFTFYEFDSNFKLLQKQDFMIPDHIMIHDWAFTETYYIIFANRIKLDVTGAITAVSGITPMITALSANPSKNTTPIYLLPRSKTRENGFDRDWRVAVEAPSRLWLLHVANSYQHFEENENGNLNIQIIACACSYQWFNFHKLFGYDWRSGKLDPSIMNINDGKNDMLPHLIQVSITLNADGTEKCDVEPLNQWESTADFPIINPEFSGLKNKYVYAAASSGSRPTLPNFPFDNVAKLNLFDRSIGTWSVGPRRFVGEPIFVPKGGTDEDDGYLLVVEYAVSVQRCYLVILNPKRIGEKDALVARLEIPKHLNFPLGFHGCWANAK